MSNVLALFDVDGTLVDSQAVIVETMTRAFTLSDLPPPQPREIRALIGLSLPIMISRLADGQPQATISRIHADYRLGFAGAMEAQTASTLFDGVAQGLADLKAAGVAMGVATGKSKRGLDRLIRTEGWDDLFVTLQCADFHPSKPHPSMIRQALLETASESEEAVMIGDSVYDMEMARAADVAAIGVAWGYHPPEALRDAGATEVVETFADLVTTILERAA